MTTNDPQQRLIEPKQEVQAYEALVALHLDRLRVWTALPDERTDWDLETLLDDLRTASLALRRLRGDADLPF